MKTNTPALNELTTKTEVLQPQYIENHSVVSRVDGKTISDDELPYLIQVGYEKALSADKTTENPKFHRTERDEELSFQFFMKHAHIADSMADNFMNLYNSSRKTNDLAERIHLLEDAVAAFEKTKKFCYSKGKGGTIYFQDMWEYMHNSENECFSYLDTIKESLNQALWERDVIIPDIIRVVSQTDGILQKDIYNELPDVKKADIQRIIRHLESQKQIQRIKKSSSYELHLTQ